MDYSLTFRIRLWARRWFFHPIKSLKTVWYNFKENNNGDLFIKDLDRFLISHEGDNEPFKKTRPVKDLNVVQDSVRNDGHHRG